MKVAILGKGKMGLIRAAALPSWCRVFFADNHDDSMDLMRQKDIDAVIICTPNEHLAYYVRVALTNGKHVFCEKPPGRNMGELDYMMEAEADCPSRVLMFGFNHRHHDSMIHAKKVIDSGELGNVLWMRGRYGKSVDDRFFDTWRADRKKAGGGIFLDQGIHMLDLFLMFAGDFDKVHAFVSNTYWKKDIEDNVFAIFQNTTTGVSASLHSTMTQWRHLFSLEIFLEKGYITINGLKTPSGAYGDEHMTIVKNRTEPPAAKWSEELDITFHTDNSWTNEMKIFLNCIRNREKAPIGNSTDAKRLMALVERIYHGS